jgi:hypothetical protein
MNPLKGISALPHYFTLNPRKESVWAGERLFFVTGRPKCGNTWLAKMISKHPRLFCDPSENCCYHYEFKYSWNEESPEELTDTVINLFTNQTEDITKLGLLSALAKNCPKRFASLYGDKTPSIDIHKALKAFPKARFIITVRDPRDMIVSFAFHSNRTNSDWSLAFEDSSLERIKTSYIEDVIAKFRRFNDYETYYKLSYDRPEQAVLVRYEDMLTDAEENLSKIFEFLGHPLPPSKVLKIIEANSFKNVTKGRNVGEQDANSFLRKGIAGDWKNVFSPDQSALIEEGFAAEMKLGGYLQGQSNDS